ncbi:bifunctional aminoglycoside phosphotransferase/ATP-binding protein [Amycolatopsis alkalitolerans]|uniref:Gluconate kinase n=1 Tax=Amycolatopsis alkalitolerans TaxID=2547244 RepID=A0A5C4LR40_9PSEU|nr:bifunctional aminoglycoside phosphotransferase/ATP-binding protein [Amycolatopsis alkalitolerans]TNC19333.1 gluconate kinase [Amycolatopsis alkalitolerans]
MSASQLLSELRPNRTDQPWSAVRETHIGAVFLVGDLAYKLKKPVDFGFLDFTRRETREQVCHKEVALNRRLAPETYLGVADVKGPDGEICDHLVVMRRMPDERRLSALVRDGAPLTDTIRDLARIMARFHEHGSRGPAITAQGSRDAILGRWRDSFAQVRPFHGHVLDAAVAAEIERLVEEFLAGREALFARRMRTGRIVDGHGDLLADDIFCLDQGPQILDCLEFDDNLRSVDGLDDVAFLAMDLERLGSPELGELLLEHYAEFSADPAPPALRHHYLAYRAFVRAKVACLRHSQGDHTAARLAREYAELTLRHLRAGQVRLILVGGLPASGKSTLASAIADRLGATLLRSDRVRKELAGIPAERRAAAEYEKGLYTAEFTAHTYAELNHRAEELLSLGETVVLDASWRSADRRLEAASVGARTHSSVIPLRCWAPEATTAARMATRQDSISDATPEIARRMATNVHPWPDAHTIFTAGTEQDSLTQALGYLG